FLPAFLFRESRYNSIFWARDMGKNELGNTVTRLDPYALAGRIAIPSRDQARPLVIGVDHPDRVAEHQAFLVTETGTRDDQPTPTVAAAPKGNARRDQNGGRLRLHDERTVDAGMQIETSREA